jgi:glycosyltransferase involved in cell wall biosynthesis
MKILWVNSATSNTLSNTRLFGMPPVFIKRGHPSIVLIGGRLNERFPEYFSSLPIPFNRIGLYQRLTTLLLPPLLHKHKPDVVITDWMSGKMARAVVLLRKMGFLKCKLVHDVRTVPVKDDCGKSHSVYAGSLKYAKGYFDGVTTITEPMRDEICAEFGYNPEQIAVWTSGVDVNHFKPQEVTDLRKELGLADQFVVFYHGAVNENRGVVELAEAAQFLRDVPEFRLVIIGGGNQWDKLQSVVRQKQLDQVILKPGVPYAEIPRWIALADLCVVPLPDHPWWRVSSPLKLMEYLAMGKPVVLTEMKAHRAIVEDDDDAFYIPNAEPAALAAGIRKAMAAKDRFQEVGTKGRQKAVKELTWEGQAKILEDYLERVLAGQVNIRSNSI